MGGCSVANFVIVGLGRDVVMATGFSAEVLISDDVVVFSLGDWVVARVFALVDTFSSTKGVVDGISSSVGAAADDVIAFMVIGSADVIKSASSGEDKIRVDFTIFTCFVCVGFRV